MAEHGVVSFLCDNGGHELADPLIRIDDQWAACVARYAPRGKPPFVRAPLTAGSKNEFYVSRVAPAFTAYRVHDIEAIPVFSQSFHRPWELESDPGRQAEMSPNAPLTLVGPEYGPTPVNRYIQEVSVKLYAVARPLVTTYGLRRAWCWNEPNILGLGVKPGQYCPPTPHSQAALSPAAFGALSYLASLRMAAAGVKEVYLGALSCLIEMGTDPKGTWVAGYLNAMYSWLSQYPGVHRWPWQGVSVNLEGPITAPYAKSVADALRSVMAKWGDHGKLVCSEWGWRADRFHAGQAAEALAAVDAYFDVAAFFSHPTADGGYELDQWRQAGHTYVVTGQTAFGEWLPGAYAALPPTS